MGAITNKHKWRIVRKEGNFADAAFHHSCGGNHTNSQSLLSQPITLIWALTRTNSITHSYSLTRSHSSKSIESQIKPKKPKQFLTYTESNGAA